MENIIAVTFGLRWVEHVQPFKKRVRVICSDSAAACKDLSSLQTVREDLVLEICIMLLWIQRMGLEVQFCWIPAGMGIKGNEQAVIHT